MDSRRATILPISNIVELESLQDLFAQVMHSGTSSIHEGVLGSEPCGGSIQVPVMLFHPGPAFATLHDGCQECGDICTLLRASESGSHGTGAKERARVSNLGIMLLTQD